jgi:hypothetical protein
MPFDPTKPVRTRDGESARIICMDRRRDDYPIVALIGDRDCINTFSANGRTETKERGSDLVNITKKVKGWVNIYRYRSGDFAKSCCTDERIYGSREEADSASPAYPERIDCAEIEIEW